uniref:butyrophilin subfamily 3 member A2-like isoform X2 n=1 Tax=Scatophagus argus TaxID=75038 RepID=UPI001ED85F2B|nr:butyrophilin subfamily 3 member A2-like isoform X2 [Scatophagus argus]
MYYHLFQVAALLCCCSGESSLHGPPQTVLAFAGSDVILPCSFNITDSDEFPTVEWSRSDLQPDVIFLYRGGCETLEMKNPAYQYRTSFVAKELKNRNISLRISNVQLSDTGTYRCMRLWKDAPRDITTVELVVGAVSEPQLSVVSAGSAGVTVECEATCWLPKPDVRFLDERGNDVPSDGPKTSEEARGCFTVRSRVTLQDATSRVTCRVHQSETNQTRDKSVIVPVDFRSYCFSVAAFTAGGTILLGLLLSGLATLLWKLSGKREVHRFRMVRRPSDQTTLSGTESHSLLQSVVVDSPDNSVNSTDERLQELDVKLQEKDEIIRRLQNLNKSHLCPACRPVEPKISCRAAASTSNLHQNKDPKPGVLRWNRSHGHLVRRNNSSPAILSLANAPKKNSSQIVHSLSFSPGLPGPKVPKLQRRHSFRIPSSARSGDPFTPLSDVAEESELLIQ